jgi:type II secretory pathway component GspD/PulD (secretin)
MSEFKGTQGKWTSLKPQDGNGFVYVNNEYLTTGTIATCYGDGEEPQANALLISKAPEMLEMLKKILDNSDVPNVIYDEAKQLIKEATEL